MVSDILDESEFSIGIKLRGKHEIMCNVTNFVDFQSGTQNLRLSYNSIIVSAQNIEGKEHSCLLLKTSRLVA